VRNIRAAPVDSQPAPETSAKARKPPNQAVSRTPLDSRASATTATTKTLRRGGVCLGRPFGGAHYAAATAKNAAQSVSNNNGNNGGGDKKGGDNKAKGGDNNGGNNNKPDKDEYFNGKKCGHEGDDKGPKKPNPTTCPPSSGPKK
jgi:hypothetical protein